MSKPWFRVHKFWGWYPVNWQAWLTISAMAISVAGILIFADTNSRSVSDTVIAAFPPISLIVTSAIFIALLKGEQPTFGKGNQQKRDYSPDDPKIYIILPFLSLLAALYYLSFSAIFGAVVFLVEAFVLYIIFKEINLLTKP